MHALTLIAAAAPLIAASPGFAQDAAITSNAETTAVSPLTESTTQNARVAAERFVQHVNYARVALGVKNISLAEDHLAQAQSMVEVLKAATANQRRATRVESGRVVYDYPTTSKYHYFPIEAGPVEVKKLERGPFWAKSEGVAVTEADIVYLSLDLTGDVADKHLSLAHAALQAGNVSEADKQLVQLIDAVVQVEERAALPLEKARDNLALAQKFVSMGNYDGARYPLKHADNALAELERDANYAGRRDAIAQMRGEVSELQRTIMTNDPTLLEKADAKIQRWWASVRDWANQP